MRDIYLCLMAGWIVIAYSIYMVFGPGGDGIIFASVIGAVCALSGIYYQKKRGGTSVEADASGSISTEYQVQ